MPLTSHLDYWNKPSWVPRSWHYMLRALMKKAERVHSDPKIAVIYRHRTHHHHQCIVSSIQYRARFRQKLDKTTPPTPSLLYDSTRKNRQVNYNNLSPPSSSILLHPPHASTWAARGRTLHINIYVVQEKVSTSTIIKPLTILLHPPNALLPRSVPYIQVNVVVPGTKIKSQHVNHNNNL